MTVEIGPIVPPQLEKRLLNNVTGMLFIAHDPPRVPQQIPLETQEDPPHPLGLDRVSVVHPRHIRSSAPAPLDAESMRLISQNFWGNCRISKKVRKMTQVQ